ncbi:MAG TPA: Fe(2+)-trafficking protein [Candidatus Polarisedimenticolaceae bacterium]|nr:Fe(2+)-trafficking protein [Candidatus Polarisedimenticolaceae bacterium]
MGQVACSRCGSLAEGLARPPLPPPWGERLLEQTCAGCWDDWKETQVKLINEYRLNVVDPADFARLMDEMSTFLALRGDGRDEV